MTQHKHMGFYTCRVDCPCRQREEAIKQRDRDAAYAIKRLLANPSVNRS